MKNNSTRQRTSYRANLFSDKLNFHAVTSIFTMSIEKFHSDNEIITYQYNYLDKMKKYFLFILLALMILLLNFNFYFIKRKVNSTSIRINKFSDFYAKVVNNSLNGLIFDFSKVTFDLNTLSSNFAKPLDSNEDKHILLSISDNRDGKDVGNNVDKDKDNIIKDELEDFKNLITQNLDIFKVDFTIDQKIYDTNKVISALKKEFIRDHYTKIMLTSKIKLESSFDDASESSVHHFSEISDDTISNNMNFHLLYELLSTEIIQLDKYIPNFYFKESKPLLFDFYNQIENLLFNDEIQLNELTDMEKIEKSLSYYINEIHKKWMKKYDSQNYAKLDVEEVIN